MKQTNAKAVDDKIGDYLLMQARNFCRARVVAVRLLPADVVAAAIAVLALAAELEAITDKTDEPALAAIRQQWWVDALGDHAGSETISQQVPALRVLHPYLAQIGPVLREMAETPHVDQGDEAATADAWIARLYAFDGAIWEAMARLSIANPTQRQLTAARLLGAAWGGLATDTRRTGSVASVVQARVASWLEGVPCLADDRRVIRPLYCISCQQRKKPRHPWRLGVSAYIRLLLLL